MQPNIKIGSVCKHAVCISAEMPLENESIETLDKLNIESEVITRYCHKVSFNSLNQHFAGLGFRNKNGGFQYYNSQITKSPVTIGNKGISIVYAFKRKRSSSCLIFFNFIDFLSYKSSNLSRPNFSDCIILNEISNVCELIDAIKNYNSIQYMFDSSSSAQILIKTIFSLYPSKKFYEKSYSILKLINYEQ